MRVFSICLSVFMVSLINPLNAWSQVENLNQEIKQAVPATEPVINQEFKIPQTQTDSPVINAEIVKPTEAPSISIESQDNLIPAPVAGETLKPVANTELAAPNGNTNLVAIDHAFFNKMKSLAGRWDGTAKNEANQPEDKIAVIYEITAGGNAVMERLFPGTKQEMITLYYENKGKLMLTHYSILGNRPVMQLKEAHENVFEFEFIPNTDLNPVVDTHMNSLKIAFVDENHMNQVWMMFEGGKPAGSYSFQLTRVPANGS